MVTQICVTSCCTKDDRLINWNSFSNLVEFLFTLKTINFLQKILVGYARFTIQRKDHEGHCFTRHHSCFHIKNTERQSETDWRQNRHILAVRRSAASSNQHFVPVQSQHSCCPALRRSSCRRVLHSFENIRRSRNIFIRSHRCRLKGIRRANWLAGIRNVGRSTVEYHWFLYIFTHRIICSQSSHWQTTHQGQFHPSIHSCKPSKRKRYSCSFNQSTQSASVSCIIRFSHIHSSCISYSSPYSPPILAMDEEFQFKSTKFTQYLSMR